MSATTGSTRGNKTSLARNSKTSLARNSKTPSSSSSIESGYRLFDAKVRSVLCHPIGLPLVAAFYRKALPRSLSYPVSEFPQEIGTYSTGDEILFDCYTKGMREKKLTEALQGNIDKKFQFEFDVTNEETIHKCGRTDLAFFSLTEKDSNKTLPDTPLCVAEVGLNSADWWKKFHQGFQYVEKMRGETEGRMCFQKPLLLVIITLDDKDKDVLNFRMGVFLCTPKSNDDFRISLVWHKQSITINDASESFGILLRILPHFQQKRDSDQCNSNDYEYFSSNCCKVGNMVRAEVAFLLQDQFFMCWLEFGD